MTSAEIKSFQACCMSLNIMSDWVFIRLSTETVDNFVYGLSTNPLTLFHTTYFLLRPKFEHPFLSFIINNLINL